MFDDFVTGMWKDRDENYYRELLRIRTEKSSCFPISQRKVEVVGIQRGYSGAPCRDAVSEIEIETQRMLEGRPPRKYNR